MQTFRDALRPGLVVIAAAAIALLVSAAALYNHVTVEAFAGPWTEVFEIGAVGLALLIAAAWILSRKIGVDGDRIVRTSWGQRVELRLDEIARVRIVESLEQMRSMVYSVTQVTIVGRNGKTIRFRAGDLPALDGFLANLAITLAQSLRSELGAGIPWGKRARLVSGGLEVTIRGERTVLAPHHVVRTMKIPAGLLVYREGDVDSCVTLPLDVDNAIALRALWGVRSDP